MTLDDLVATYVKARLKKAKLKSEYDEKVKPVDAVMDRIEAELLNTFNTMGVDSIKTPSGTAYVTTKSSATVADREAFRQYLLQNDAWELADLRAAKLAIEQFKESNQELPPGINYSATKAVNFRSA